MSRNPREERDQQNRQENGVQPDPCEELETPDPREGAPEARKDEAGETLRKEMTGAGGIGSFVPNAGSGTGSGAGAGLDSSGGGPSAASGGGSGAGNTSTGQTGGGSVMRPGSGTGDDDYTTGRIPEVPEDREDKTENGGT